jgi:glycosyltransferase involved in cell wall biosynthesis
LRILFLEYRDPLNPYVGGGDIYLNELAKGCARKGHSVTIIASRFSGSSAEDEIDGVHVLRIGSRFTLFIKTFLQYFSYLRGRFDVVVEEIMGGPRVPFFASIYMKEPIVGILQQKHREIFRHQFPFLIASFLSFLERFLVLLYRNKQLVVNSQRTKNELGAIGYVADNMHIVNPGLPPHFFETIGPLFSRRKPRVICLTKIRRYKLIDNAIRAMKMVCQNLPECQLVIAGRTNDVEPEYEIELRKLIADLDLGDNIIFKKDVSERQKIELLASSRALVLPSAIEGFGIVVTEANA